MGLLRRVKRGLFLDEADSQPEYGHGSLVGEGAYRKRRQTEDEREDADLILRILYGQNAEAPVEEQLEKLDRLRDRGIVTGAEYDQMRQDLVANSRGNSSSSSNRQDGGDPL